MSFTVQPGQTIRDVTRNLGCSFNQLKSLNPEAIGRTNDGRYFFKAGAELQVPGAEPVQPAKVQPAVPAKTPQPVQAVQTGETVAAASRRLGVPYAALIQANLQNIVQNDDGRYAFRSGSRVDLPKDFKTVLAEKTSTPKVEPKPKVNSAPSTKPRAETTVPAEPSSDEPSEPSVLDRILQNVSVSALPQDAASQSNLKSPDQPLKPSQEDLVRLKCGLAPNLDLTLGLTQEKTMTDEGLERNSSPWSNRSYSIGLTFRF